MNDPTPTPIPRAHLERRLARIWGARIGLMRQRRGLSQEALAVACGVTQQTISKIEHGQVSASDGLKLELAAALGMVPGQLFSWPDELRVGRGPGGEPGGVSRRS